MVADEHRKAARTDVSLIARVRPLRSTNDLARRTRSIGIAVTDVSLLGLSFLTDQLFNVGDMLEVDLAWGSAEISFHGAVRHVDVRSSLSTVGIQFVLTQSTKHAVATLRDWMETIADASPTID